MANEAATAKDAQFVLISLLPDVCLTPTKSGYPVPYVITHKMDQSEQCSPTSSSGASLPTCTTKAM